MVATEGKGDPEDLGLAGLMAHREAQEVAEGSAEPGTTEDGAGPAGSRRQEAQGESLREARCSIQEPSSSRPHQSPVRRWVEVVGWVVRGSTEATAGTQGEGAVPAQGGPGALGRIQVQEEAEAPEGPEGREEPGARVAQEVRREPAETEGLLREARSTTLER